MGLFHKIQLFFLLLKKNLRKNFSYRFSMRLINKLDIPLFNICKDNSKVKEII
jgi:hypothetical protein